MEDVNNAEWLDNNLTAKERARLSKENAIRIVAAILFWLVVMWALSRLI